ncbi:MAG: RHS repeat-associated core domain-containing protein [Ruminococcus sp.]|nr:RHS repeat-associated core domain-containing protein [Ruminococcus sp.]
MNHVWDGSQQIVADIVENQFYEASCYIRGTNLVAKYNFFNGAKSEYTYYTQNAHGDVVNITNADGNVTKTYTYDAFGVEKNIDASDTNAFRYCGEYYDAETGTIYLRARYYNPSIGRFITRDSYSGKISDPLSLNLYTYCANNPIVYIDPSGHIALTKWCKSRFEDIKEIGKNVGRFAISAVKNTGKNLSKIQVALQLLVH